MQLESSVTLFDDNKVENRFAELQITADGITAEVGRKVGNDEVISRINQSAESIQIQAGKVNIEGATIFTDGRLSQNSLNNAYDAKGAASSALGDAQNYADNAVSGKANKTDAVARQQRIYYRKTSAGAPSKNTTWLSTSGTGYGNWSLKIPQMTSGTTKYPYLYTAVQTQTVSQASGSACSCSDVLLDDTTTVIDGGTIITGTVNANAVNANSGTFNTANIPNLSANKINSGTISVGVLPSDALNSTYITDIGNDGIRVHDSHTSNNSAVINSSGMEVFKGGTTDTYSVAKYGDSARIGKAASKHISIDATNGMQVWTGTESDSTNVAQFNDTVRVGKKNHGRIEISNGSIDVYTGTSNIQKVATFTQIGNAGGLQIYDNQLSSTPKIGTLFADSLSFGDNDDSGVLYWNSSRNDFHMSNPLSVAGHINPIGYVEDGYARYSTSIPNNTATQLAYVVLSEGTWMVVCGVRSPSNATGNRMANLSTTSGDSTNFDIIQRAVSGQPTQLQFTVVVTPTTAKTYYLNACHDAGVTLSYPAGSEGHNNFIRAVRIA